MSRQDARSGAGLSSVVTRGTKMPAARVLVVEDVPELSRLLEMTFELDERFEPVGTASSGGAALDLAAREQPDAVVLDLTIEGLAGMDVLPALRQILPEARIIIFTGHDDAGLRARAMEA